MIPSQPKKFKAERQEGWSLIDLSIEHMNSLSKDWTLSNNIERLNHLKSLLEEFRSAQQEIENISHTPANTPALHLLITEAAPRAEKMLAAISTMIDEESALEATEERKALLKLLADSRGSFAIGLASIRAFLLTGDTQFSRAFEEKWAVNEARFVSLTKPEVTYLFNAQQYQAWNTYKTLRSEFSLLPSKMFKLRDGKDWNLANYWLGTKAAPKAAAIFTVLDEMRISQEQLTKEDQSLLVTDAQNMKVIMLIGTFLALVTGSIISISVSRMISFPLRRVVKRAEAIGKGDLSGEILKSKGSDE